MVVFHLVDRLSANEVNLGRRRARDFKCDGVLRTGGLGSEGTQGEAIHGRGVIFRFEIGL
jgi:hypothetical protein